jgi:transcription initiation factor TFIIE subunit alpha
MRSGANKASSREFFYIDYRRALDAVKYKIYKIDEGIKKDAKPSTEKPEFKCLRCKSTYTTMQALDHPDMNPGPDDSGFVCARCGFRLDEIDPDTQADDIDDTPAKFNKLFGPLITKMQEIEDIGTLPLLEPVDVIKERIELPRDKQADPGTQFEVIETVGRPTAVKGIDTGPEKITVQIGSKAEETAKQQAADKERLDKISQQNQLPTWHTQSTVIKDAAGNTANVKQESNADNTPKIKTETSDTLSGSKTTVDAIFAMIEAERRKKEQEEEEEEEEEDDDEDEFEDVEISTSSALPDAKRVKLDSSTAPTPSAAATPVAVTPAASNGGEESEEDEFEDVN